MCRLHSEHSLTKNWELRPRISSTNSGAGHSAVFKGTLLDNRLVAVKRLEGCAQAEKQFWAEISTIRRIQHVNLVRLLGFCMQGSQRLLAHFYMPNGSLNSCVFCKDEEVEKVLDWDTRFEIVLELL
ncbi:hypothetical protein SUGI_0674400 [Cryptomeria japonica]|nr:hypothetical protein SUGI_0674400 [Cryptomeria japonica]